MIHGFSIEETMIARAYSGCGYIWNIFMAFVAGQVSKALNFWEKIRVMSDAGIELVVN